MWIDIEGFEGRYEVCDSGVVRRKEIINSYIKNGVDTKRTLKSKEIGGSVGKRGYKVVDLTNNDGTRFRSTIHREVAKAFCEVPSNSGTFKRLVVNHIDGDKMNNKASNLEWCDDVHNNQHAYDTGLKKVSHAVIQHAKNLGVSHKGKVFKDRRVLQGSQIADVISLYNSGATLNSIASKYGVTRAPIKAVLKDNGISLRAAGKQVDKLDVKTMKVVCTYNTAKDAGVSVGISSSNIVAVCNGRRRVAAGYCWQYSTNLVEGDRNG